MGVAQNLRAAALCRPRLADRGRCCDNYDYVFVVGFNGTLKAYMNHYMKEKSTTIMMMLLMMQIITQH